MANIHNLGFPRFGARREMKRSVEAYWRGEIDQSALAQRGQALRERHWLIQRDAGLDQVPVGDFSWYDHVLDTSAMLGAVPARFGSSDTPVDLDTVFRMARGDSTTAPCEMTKWFDTNYHYIVPELHPNQPFSADASRLVAELGEAEALGVPARPVLLGPLTWLWLSKPTDEAFDRLTLLDAVTEAYAEVLRQLGEAGASWVQIDEPILVLDLPEAWQNAFERVYARLTDAPSHTLLTSYFAGLGENLPLVMRLPVAGVHLDAVRAPDEVAAAAAQLPAEKTLSLGLIDGRNVWRADLAALLETLEPLQAQLGERLWLAPSCSLLHVPVDLELETGLDAEIRQWLAFAVQKLDELAALKRALTAGRDAVATALTDNRAALAARQTSPRSRDRAVRERTAGVGAAMLERRSAHAERSRAQQARLGLPELPTTTIGSFPQTDAIRKARRDWRAGRLSEADYEAQMRREIAACIQAQEAAGLDMLVHGEPERNDMVEYFGERLAGFAFTAHGWVQSYGSRGVKPPILFGDVSRPDAISVPWIEHARGLTERPVKGMLTGPVTILQWSFVRDDLPRASVAQQVALALRDEVADLEQVGTAAIQIDEPALREGLPLRRAEWQAYLRWAVDAFRLATSGVADATQIHTHMCYSEFNDIVAAIAELDADVITIEAARSRMELLDAFDAFAYPNDIGPGIYDIHAPRVPSVEEMTELLGEALERIPRERLWVNPDCGLKTRSWTEIRPALANMVAAAAQVRQDRPLS